MDRLRSRGIQARYVVIQVSDRVDGAILLLSSIELF